MIKIAMIEDNVQTSALIAGWLRESPFFQCVAEFPSAELAIAELLRFLPDVITDNRLPGINGIECVRQLKTRLPGAQFVMLTVFTDSNHCCPVKSGRDFC